MADPKVNKLGQKVPPEQQETVETSDVFQTPPPAEPIPGISGNPPLPVGEPIGIVTPAAHRPREEADYTEEELKTLRTIPGWKPGVPIPENLANVLDQVSQTARDEALNPDRLQPPVSQDTPPLEVPKPLDVSQLPHEKQEEIRQLLEQNIKHEEAAATAAARQIPGAGPGVNEALSGESIKRINLVDDTDAETYAGTDVPKSVPVPPADSAAVQAPVEPTSITGLDDSRVEECPRCGWNLAVPDILKIEPGDIQRFIQCSLGGRSFEKMYELLGGNLQVIFRELNPLEVDKCYQAVYYLREQNEVASPQEFLEVLVRYRLCLQLKLIRTDEEVYEFPASIDAWNLKPDKSKTCLPEICKQVLTKVIRKESLLRMLSQCLGNFNQTLAKMEANSQNPDFWRETESVT